MAIQEEVTMSINDATPDEWDEAYAARAAYDPVTQKPRKTVWDGQRWSYAYEEWDKERNRKASDTVESWTVDDDDYNTTTFGPLEVENPKAAIGAAKAPFFGIPWTAVIEMGTVMDGGAHKYGAYNYRDTRISTTTYHDAILRHFMLWADGEDDDPESKASHLAHVMACCALMIDADHGDMLEDDRSKTGNVRYMLEESARTAREFRNGEG
jgi:hypothetical protein